MEEIIHAISRIHCEIVDLANANAKDRYILNLIVLDIKEALHLVETLLKVHEGEK